MLHTSDLTKILTTTKHVKTSELQGFLDAATKEKLALEEYVVRIKVITEPELYRAAADLLQLPFTDLKEKTISKETLLLVPEQFAYAHAMIAWNEDASTIHVTSTDPYNTQAIDFIEKKTGRVVERSLTTPTNIREALKLYHRGLAEEVAGLQAEAATTDLPAVQVVNAMMQSAISESASDIHIEPTEQTTTIRFRVDGMLKKTMELPKIALAGIIARIKVLADLKIDEHRLPQDGRFKRTENNQHISCRVSIIPVADGEKAVIRLLNETTQPLSLDQLGFQPAPLAIVERNIKKPHGMLLVTGPTGSGKTTTLYTLLHMVNTPEVNILTVEDPIEYRMPGVNQSQINPRIGFTFANALRSFLRQDPNIIMVGEIRDTETADIAINAALTGHLVLSTLHTNDAVTTLPRLLDMGIAPFLIASTVNVIIAQRLVRKICQSCVEHVKTDPKMLEELQRLAVGTVLKNQKLSEIRFSRGKGCKQCNNEGYKGRIGIYEVLEMTPELGALILKRAAREELIKAATEQKMLSLFEDGVLKAKSGITTIEEILRVTKE